MVTFKSLFLEPHSHTTQNVGWERPLTINALPFNSFRPSDAFAVWIPATSTRLEKLVLIARNFLSFFLKLIQDAIFFLHWSPVNRLNTSWRVLRWRRRRTSSNLPKIPKKRFLKIWMNCFLDNCSSEPRKTSLSFPLWNDGSAFCRKQNETKKKVVHKILLELRGSDTQNQSNPDLVGKPLNDQHSAFEQL